MLVRQTDVALLGATALGAWWWMAFFHYGQLTGIGPYDIPQIMDWLRLLQVAVTTHELPLYMAQHADRYWVHYQDNSVGELLFWAHPMTPLLPQAAWLTVLPVGQTIAATVLWFYLLGALGVATISRVYKLEPIPAVLLHTLLLMNGFLVAKFAVWHLWESMFLLPWLVFFVFQAVEGARSPRSAIGLGFVLTAIVYHGYLHALMIFGLFLGLLAVCVPWCAWWVLQVIAWTTLLGAAKFVPIFWMYTPEPRAFFNPGYSSLAQLWAALTGQGVIPAWTYWWEYDGYIGIAATCFIVAYGIVTPWKSQGWRRHIYLALPISVMVLWTCTPELNPFSWGPLHWWWWHSLPLSMFMMERMPSRFLVVPYSLIATAACIALQRKIHEYRLWSILGVLVFVFTAWGIQTHAAPLRASIVGGEEVPPAANVFLLSNPPDQQIFQTGLGEFALAYAGPPKRIVYNTFRYRTALVIGSIISLGSLLTALLILTRSVIR